MSIADSLENKIKALEKTKQNITAQKDILKEEIQGEKKGFWGTFKDGYFHRKKKKQGIVIRTITQIILFFVNFAIFNYIYSIYGWEETIFLMLITIITITGYIGYNQTNERE